MTPQEQIHTAFVERFHKGESTALVSKDDIAFVEATSGVLLPTAYCTFLEQFGPIYTPDILDIVVLRKSPIIAVQEFLGPADVIENSADIGNKGCVAFANDCSGNLFCFKRLPTAEPRLDDAPIWLFDHETGKTSKVAPAFDTWLSNFTQLQPLLQDRSPDARAWSLSPMAALQPICGRVCAAEGDHGFTFRRPRTIPRGTPDSKCEQFPLLS